MISAGYKKTKIGIIPDVWEVKILGEVSTFMNGYAFNSKHYSDSQEDMAIIRMSNITNKGFLDISENRIKRFPYDRKNEVKNFICIV